MADRSVAPQLLLIIVVCTAALAVPGTAAATNHTDRPEVDTTTTSITVHENGDATWTLELRTKLDSETEVENYEVFQDQFQNSTETRETELTQQLQNTADAASNNTGRTMEIENTTATTRIESIPQQWGVVSYTFTWTNFATVSETTISVGDAFENGLYLGDTDSLEISTDSSATVNSTSPTPDSTTDGTAVWNGEQNFAANEPTVTFTQATTAPISESNFPLTPAHLAGGIVLLTAALVAFGFYKRKQNETSTSDSNSTTTAGTPPVVSNSATDDDTEEPVTNTDENTDASSSTTSDLLSDEEQVIEMLKDNDGRVKQAEIVAQTGWSSSKVSRLLTAMEDDDNIKRLRIGRENVVDINTDDPYEDY